MYRQQQEWMQLDSKSWWWALIMIFYLTIYWFAPMVLLLVLILCTCVPVHDASMRVPWRFMYPYLPLDLVVLHIPRISRRAQQHLLIEGWTNDRLVDLCCFTSSHSSSATINYIWDCIIKERADMTRPDRQSSSNESHYFCCCYFINAMRQCWFNTITIMMMML